MLKFSILALAALTFGCATTQQKDVDTVATIAGAIAESGVLGKEVSSGVKKAVDVVGVARDLQNEVQDNTVVVVMPHDTLWGIAAKAYGGHTRAPRGKGGFLWPIICYQNNLDNCNLIKPFQILRIPKPEKIAAMPVSQILTYLEMAYEAK